jgi:hypothetical protein
MPGSSNCWFNWAGGSAMPTTSQKSYRNNQYTWYYNIWIIIIQKTHKYAEQVACNNISSSTKWNTRFRIPNDKIWYDC